LVREIGCEVEREVFGRIVTEEEVVKKREEADAIRRKDAETSAKSY
jgi:hypothetical protein